MELDTGQFKRTMQTIWIREYADTLPTDTEYTIATGYKFVDYILETYGVQVITTCTVNNQLNIEQAQVVDPRKYMLLQLKFC